MIEETLFDAEEKMEKAVTVAKDDLSSVRTGRATPSMFSRVVVDYYGAFTPLNQLASVSVPEARMAVIKPYDASQIGAIEKAVRDSDLGVNPTNDGQVLRVVFPQLTEERRRDLAKQAKSEAEDAKIGIRNSRKDANTEIKKLEKSGLSEDVCKSAEDEVQTLTNNYIRKIDDLLAVKEAESMKV